MNIDKVLKVPAGSKDLNLLLGDQLNTLKFDAMVQFALVGVVAGDCDATNPGPFPGDDAYDLTVNIFSGTDLVVQGGNFTVNKMPTQDSGCGAAIKAEPSNLPVINAESYIWQDVAEMGDKLGVFVTHTGSNQAYVRVSIVMQPIGG